MKIHIQHLFLAVALLACIPKAIAQTSFVLSTNYPLNPNVSGSLSVVAFTNTDGLVDLVYSGGNDTTSSLTLLTNNGGGIFTSNHSYAVGSAPVAVTAADVNGDGKMDLISANQNDNSLSVLTNNGSGGFVLSSTVPVPYVDGARPAPTAVVAFKNVDGKMDLASADGNLTTVSIFTNDGSGNFTFVTNITTGSTPHSITAADVNNDGAMDLICANESSSTLSVLTNNGSGGFGFATNISVGSEPVFVVAADVNKDGWVDLICANFGDGTLSVVTNNGSGGFALATIPVGSHPYSVCAADVNGDGWPDFIGANGGTDSLTVLTNNGTRRFCACDQSSFKHRFGLGRGGGCQRGWQVGFDQHDHGPLRSFGIFQYQHIYSIRSGIAHWIGGQSIRSLLACIGYELHFAKRHQHGFSKLGDRQRCRAGHRGDGQQHLACEILPPSITVKGEKSRQLLRNVLVEDFLHGQGHDDFVAALEEGFNRQNGPSREGHRQYFSKCCL